MNKKWRRSCLLMWCVIAIVVLLIWKIFEAVMEDLEEDFYKEMAIFVFVVIGMIIVIIGCALGLQMLIVE